MEPEETMKLRLEVLKLATQDSLSGGDANRAVSAAKTLWQFFEPPAATRSSEDTRS